MSAILGINAFHGDAAACVVVDGVLVAAVAEERLGRRTKHAPGFPAHAVRRVLGAAGLRLADVTHVAVARDGRASMGAKIRYVLRHPGSGMGATAEYLRRASKVGSLRQQLSSACDEHPSAGRFCVVPVEHHLAHIAGSYYLSPFDGLSAALSYDASGDFTSLMAAQCQGTQIRVLDRVHLPDSLGLFYTAVCQHIGFTGFGEEYKVMGLAAYGEDTFAGAMRQLIKPMSDGWFRSNPHYLGMYDGGPCGEQDAQGGIIIRPMYRPAMARLLGPARDRREPLTRREEEIACSAQKRFEDVVVHCLNRLYRFAPTPRLVLAGGCALNGVMNARAYRDTPFAEQFIQSAAGDDGTAVGAAYWCYHNVVGGRERFEMCHPYWGPGYAESVVAAAARAAEGTAHEVPAADLSSTVAALLAEGKVVGWYQGRSEWGPRALGNRSIPAHPGLPNMKDLINAKIKRREAFRPFAPSVLAEHVGEIFEQDIRSPFMMHVVKIRPEWRSRLPAVAHVDGTGRLQSVTREQNPLYYDLIHAFYRRTGIPVLLNTSFNENEPIVDTPEQAVDCFRRTDMDALVLANWIVTKA